MAPISFHLLALEPSADPEAFIANLKTLPESQRPLWLGRTHHWLHEPQLSTKALLGPGSDITKWDYLLVEQDGFPDTIASQLLHKWTITADSPEGMSSVRTWTAPATWPTLPQGWSPEDHSGLDSHVTPENLSFSLGLKSRTLGSPKSADGQTAKEFIRDFGVAHPGPVVMWNLLSYLPGGRSTYLDGYGGGFSKTLNPLYSGEVFQFGLGATAWSSQNEEGGQEGGWEDTAMVWYPSIWHFGKMIDDPEYVELDRKFKPVSLRDNALVCCSEVEL